MRTLIFLVTVVIFTVSGSAQSEYPSNKGKPPKTQEELNHNLNKAKTLKTIGAVTTLGGISLQIAGFVKAVQLDEEYGAREVPQEENAKFALRVIGGGAIAACGLVVFTVGAVRTKNIKAELVKFPGSASGYGVALKIRF